MLDVALNSCKYHCETMHNVLEYRTLINQAVLINISYLYENGKYNTIYLFAVQPNNNNTFAVKLN